MSWLFKAPGLMIFLVGGMTGLVYSLGLIVPHLGVTWGVVAFLLLPVTFAVAPWYDLLVNGEWGLLAINYGAFAMMWGLYALGNSVDRAAKEK